MISTLPAGSGVVEEDYLGKKNKINAKGQKAREENVFRNWKLSVEMFVARWRQTFRKHLFSNDECTVYLYVHSF